MINQKKIFKYVKITNKNYKINKIKLRNKINNYKIQNNYYNNN